MRKIAARFDINPSTVQRISRPFDGASLTDEEEMSEPRVKGRGRGPKSKGDRE